MRLTLEKLQEIASETMPRGSSVWLYGSRARGTERTDSDWDLLVLLDKNKVDDEDFDKFGYPFISLGWKYGADVSPQLYTLQEWKLRQNTPFYSNVEQDKKKVYGAE